MKVPAFVLTVAALTLAACTSSGSTGGDPTAGGPPGSSGSSGAPSSEPAPTISGPAPAAVITSNLTKHSGVNPAQPISLSVASGRLTSVALLNPEGKKVKGDIASDGTSWKAAEDLGYHRTYQLTAVAQNGDGVAATKKITFSTLTPDNMTLPYFDTIYGSALENGGTYGIGMIPVVHFDEVIPDQAAAERALQVTTTPHVDGSWFWADDGKSVHWRPRSFYTPGTKVSIAAKVYGVNVGDDMYGQADRAISFKIGQKRVAIADASTHKVKVYFGTDNKLVRTMDTSMGRGGTVTGDHGQTIYLWTMPGTYTVLGHENPAIMSSDSYGLPANSPLGYAPEKVPYATKISTDGIYLHELDATVWAQGNTNVSHGCLNMNYDNAKWYYEHSQVGDIVKVVHSGGPKIQFWQGGDWAMSWADWLKGSALH